MSSLRIDRPGNRQRFLHRRLLSDGTDKYRMVAAAREKGIAVARLSHHSMTPTARRKLVLGFGGVLPEALRRGVKVLNSLPDQDDYIGMHYRR